MSVLKQYDAASGLWRAVGGMGLPRTACCFKAHPSADQTVTVKVENKILYQVVDFDQTGCYNASLSRFTPNIPGYYWVHGQVRLNAGSTQSQNLRVSKNGSLIANKNTQPGNNNDPYPDVFTIVYLNGTTDYVEIFLWPGATTTTDGTTSSLNGTFEAFLISDSYDATKQIIDLTNATSDYLLGVGETAKLAYSSATSVPLHIATEEGLYEITLKGSASTAATNNWTTLIPNTSGISTFTTDIIGQQSGGTPSGTTTSGASLHLQDGSLVLSKGVVSTFTDSKSAEFSGYGERTSGVRQRRKVFCLCSDTTTAWTSLGTISLSAEQSGVVIVRRVA